MSDEALSYEEQLLRNINARIPVYKVEDGRLYVDGVEVFEWQLTEEEKRKFFPDRFPSNPTATENKPADGKVNCPLCDREINTKDKRSLQGHLVTVHSQFYEQHSEVLRQTQDFTDLLNTVTKIGEISHASAQ